LERVTVKTTRNYGVDSMIDTLKSARLKPGDRVIVATGKAEAEVIDASDPAKIKVKLDGRECWVGRKAILSVNLLE